MSKLKWSLWEWLSAKWLCVACAGALILMIIAVPFVLPTLLPLIVAFFWLRHRYITTGREVKRFDATTRSPVYASFSAALKVPFSLKYIAPLYICAMVCSTQHVCSALKHAVCSLQLHFSA